jgi:hypothetical protein
MIIKMGLLGGDQRERGARERMTGGVNIIKEYFMYA